MYDNNPSSIESIAQSSGKPLHVVAIEQQSAALKNEAVWPQITEYVGATSNNKVDLLGDHFGDLLGDFSRDIAEKVQFPLSTVYLHSLGCVASAMTKSFYVNYMGTPKAVTLYVVTAQLSSTGKSAVNDCLSIPIRKAFIALNERTQSARRAYQRKIFAIENELNNTKKDHDEHDMIEMEDQLVHYKKLLAKVPKYTYFLDDVTMEGAEICAMSQSGTFNIVSSETEAITVVTGGVYGDNNSKQNFNLLLKAWDGDIASISRASREGYEGEIKATISVIAQSESVNAIMELGSSGRGIAGRFLMVNEDTMLGKRDHTGESYKKFDEQLTNSYKSMVHNIVSEQEHVVLDFEPECWKMINQLKMLIEPQLADGGCFDDAMITEFAGKADKHVTKLASVIHTSEEWRESGSRNKVIKVASVSRAIEIFKIILKNYIQTADNLGYSGVNSEVAALAEKLDGYASKNKLKIRIPTLVNNIKKVKPFRTSRNLTNLVKNKILPILQEHNYCYVVDSTIYINPKLK